MPSLLHSALERFPAWAWPLPVALCVVSGLWLGLRLARWVQQRHPARSRRLGQEGEQRALEILRRAGYRVLEQQLAQTGNLWVDREPAEFRCRADARVERDGRQWIAEFKGGPASVDPAGRDTRRQLLEYAYVYGVSGLLLVDAQSGRVHHVEFGSEPL